MRVCNLQQHQVFVVCLISPLMSMHLHSSAGKQKRDSVGIFLRKGKNEDSKKRIQSDGLEPEHARDIHSWSLRRSLTQKKPMNTA